MTAEQQRAPVHVQTGAAGRAAWHVVAARLVLRGVFRLLFRVRVVGLDNVPREQAIICANHLGWADAFLILLFLPVEPRIYALGERAGVLRNSFRIRVIGFFQVMVPLERAQPREALRIMGDVLRRGGSLIIFPEGHLGTQEGTIQPIQPGAVHLSVQSGAPIVPVGLTGTSELWLRRKLTVRIGVPIEPGAFGGDVRTRLRLLSEELDRSLRTLLPGDEEHPRSKPLRDWLTNLL